MAQTARAPGNFRYPSKRLRAMRRESLLGIERYSSFVRIMKRALPAVAAVIAIAVLAYAMQPRESITKIMKGTWSGQVDNDLTMMHPRLYGTDEGGSPFTVVADKAIQDSPNALRVRLENVRAQITMKDGLWVRLDAKQGFVDSERHQMDVSGGIRLTADGGYEAHSTRAHFDLTKGTVSGREPVSGRAPFGTFRARGFTIYKPEKQLVFTGGVDMLLYPAAAAETRQ